MARELRSQDTERRNVQSHGASKEASQPAVWEKRAGNAACESARRLLHYAGMS
ncbi:predicted protein [Coccidioides posadasii str. Silveira]|uniref:Predicted protein n=1 Tax=Coccidioides posadasii (strain RMSCC 757 / Silveira) TaxID=443226 RepID=E9CT72_COCPS|nr:predicted protein [Coccidioides posadasii str. Silveira]